MSGRELLELLGVPPRVASAVRWALAGALGLALLLTLVTQVPRLWGVDWVWENVDLLGPPLAAGWSGALWAEWRRTHRPALRPTAAPAAPAPGAAAVWHRGADAVPPWPAGALRRARRRSVPAAARRAAAWALLPVLALAAAAGHRATAHDAELLATQEPRTALVWEVRRLPGRGTVQEVVVAVDGRQVPLAISFPGDTEVERGDALPVVVDPEDPGHVLAANSHDSWAYTPWADVLLWGSLLACLGTLAWRRLPTAAAVRTARRARTVTAARVEERYPDVAVLVVHGDRWLFEGQQPATDVVMVLGDVQDGAWVVLDDGRTRMPSGPLRAADALL